MEIMPGTDVQQTLVLRPFGSASDLAVSGDWNGDGTDQAGTFRPWNGKWYLDNGNGVWDGLRCRYLHYLFRRTG